MSTVTVITSDGHHIGVERYSIICPNCGTRISPEYLCADSRTGVLFCRCPVGDCGTHFMLRQHSTWQDLLPNHSLMKETFSPIITELSSAFVKIYNEAYAAEQMSLMEICGVGYRKALEFLVKDYAIVGKDEETVEKIKKSFLGPCIESYVTDARIKEVAKRAVWLGNDETHYVRKWENKDVQDLKGLIRLTIRWVEQEKETERLLEEMKEGR